MRALRYGSECASGYLGLLEHVLVVRVEAGTPCRVVVMRSDCSEMIQKSMSTSGSWKL